MTRLRLSPLYALASALLLCGAAMAQSAAPAVRIVTPINEDHLVPLSGNVNPQASAANDRGPVSSSFEMPELTLVLSRGATGQAAFDAFVNSQYDPGSPNYHQWLTPVEIGQRFGPSDADIATISSWLSSHGMAVLSVAPDRMTIRFRGTAGQVEGAFHTQIHHLSVQGVPRYANMTNPQIPAALAPVVMGLKGLNNFLPRPLHKVGSIVRFNKQLGHWERIVNQGTGAADVLAGPAKPEFGGGAHPMFGYNANCGSGCSYLVEDVGPYDFATMYNVLPAWQAGKNGSGQTIAIAGTSLISASDVSSFRSIFGLPAGPAINQIDTKASGTTAIECTSTSSTAVCGQSDMLENSLDVEWSGAVAPEAQIDLVVTGQPSSCTTNNSGCIDTTYDSAQYVVQNKTANILSVSYGQCELGNGTSSNVAYYNLWQSAAAEGISVFVATGDSGSPACDQGGDSSGNPYSAQFGLAVNGLASTPFNTAVGGTDFSWCKPTIDASGNTVGCPGSTSSPGPYWNSSNSSQQASAKGYVPEIPWNYTCMNPIWASYLASVATYLNVGTPPGNPEAACNWVQNNYQQIFNQSSSGGSSSPTMLAPFIDTIGGGGGMSNCVSNTYDTNPNSPTCNTSASSVTTAGGSVPLTNDGWQKPSWQVGVPGVPNDGVRDLPDVSFFAGDGDLQSATLVCDASYQQSQGMGSTCGVSINSSTGGPSLVELGGTSVASPEMAGVMALINQSAGSPQGLANPQLYSLALRQNYASCSAESVTAGTAGCFFNDVDQGTNGMPCDFGAPEGGAQYNSQTNSWQLTSTTPGINSPNCVAVNSGDKVGTLVVPGSSNTEGFDATQGYDLATGLGSLNVANVVSGWNAVVVGTAQATVTVMPSSTSVNSNVALNVSVTVAGASGTPTPTGQVTLSTSSGGFAAAQNLNASGDANFTIPMDTFTASGSVTLTARYSGDSVYASASNSATVSVNYIQPPTFTIGKIASPSVSIANAGASLPVSVPVSTSNGYVGTVTLTCTLIGAPVGASSGSLPGCMVGGPVTLSASQTSATGTVTVTTPSAVGALAYPKLGNGKGWMGAGGGAVLALLVFFGIPARRRSWRAMLGMLVLLAALGSLSACGNSGMGGGYGGGGNSNLVAAGVYSFEVTGTGNPAVNPAPGGQAFAVSVN